MNTIADRLASLKLNSCTCQGLRGDGQHEPDCPTDIINDACAALRQRDELIKLTEAAKDVLGRESFWSHVSCISNLKSLGSCYWDERDNEIVDGAGQEISDLRDALDGIVKAATLEKERKE